MGYLIYINDIAVDLKPNVLISINLQRIEFGDLSKNFINYTNTINLPKTPKNNSILGFANDEKTISPIPYSSIPCRIVSNGVEIINGNAFIKEVDDEYKINVYDSFVSILSFLEGKILSDLDIWGTEAWNAAGIDAARLKTTGLVNAYANFGRIATYEVNYYLPFFYYSTIINEALKITGLTPQGSIFSNTDFTDLVCMPFDKFNYIELQEIKRYTLVFSQNNFLFFDQQFFSVAFENIAYGTIPFTNAFVTEIKVNIYYNNLIFYIDPFSQSSITIKIYSSIQGIKATTNPIQVNYTNSNQVYNFNNIELLEGETIEVRIYFEKDAEYPGDYVYLDVGSDGNGTSYTITQNKEVARSKPYWNKLLNKNIKIKDVLKDFFMRFGIIYKIDDSTIILKTIEEIITDYSSAFDWTNKRVINKDRDKILFQTQYAQSNYFKYSDNISDSFLGQGNISILNSNLNSAKDIFTSIFKNANSWSTIKSVTLPVYDSTSTYISDQKNEPPFVLATLRPRVDEQSITFNTIPRTDYNIAYFVDATQTKDTSFQYFINKYYQSLSGALQQSKTCTYYYNLNDLDIANYDPHRMVYDNGSYYIVNKIKNYVSGEITEVELFKVN